MSRRPAVILIALLAGLLLAVAYHDHGESRQPTVYAPVPRDHFIAVAGTATALPLRPTPSAAPRQQELAIPRPTAKPTLPATPRPRLRQTYRALRTVPKASAPRTSHRISGLASWYCRAGISVCHRSYPPGSMVAAACGKLRAAMGPSWRGRKVVVRAGSRQVTVKLVDWCGSGSKLIDLYWEPMHRLGGSGVLPVTVRW